MSSTRPRARVLHSIRAPGAETRYANQMAAMSSAEFAAEFFTWVKALTGRYDIFHLHWPEHLAGRESGLAGRVRGLLVRTLIARLRRRRIPVVYTLHNHRPHDLAVSPRLARVYADFAALTRVEIHLVTEPQRDTTASVIPIPHGSYREPFARYETPNAIPGRIVTFGILKPYKGIPRLLDVFASIEDPGLSLRVVGEAADEETVRAIDAAATADRRVSAGYGFLPDEALVREVARAQLVALPYEELHSSGAALVALSLGRPVLLPESSTSRALREEVGTGWVHTYAPPLTRSALQAALAHPTPPGEPDLRSRSWDRVRDAHTEAYRRALASSFSA